MTRRGTTGRWIARSLAAVAVLLIAYFVVLVAPIPFVSSWWAPGGAKNDLLRVQHRMADWLVLRRSLDGLSRSEVVAMLGEPLEHGYFRDYDLVYRLGMERGFISIDSEWLAVVLDDSGRVASAEIVRD